MGRTRHTTSFCVLLLLVVADGFFCAADGRALRRSSGRTPRESAPKRTIPARHGEHSRPFLVHYFEAMVVPGGVDLIWAVYSEKDISGYNLYRRKAGTGPFFLVNEHGLTPAWQLEYIDGDVQRETVYHYVLGVVQADGTESLSASVRVKTGAGRAFAASRRPVSSARQLRTAVSGGRCLFHE